MKNILLLSRRELGAYVKSPLGYVIVAVVLALEGLFFNVWALGGTPKYSAEVLSTFFAVCTFFSMVAGILLSMRLLAEEKQMGTLTLLLTSPVREYEIVLGKFFSAFIFFFGMTALSIYMPLLIFVNGKVSLGHIFGGYLGLLLLGLASLAVGLFASAISRFQVVAAVVGAAILTTLYLCYLAASIAEPPLRDLLSFLSPQKHLQWQNGIINSQDVLFYLSITYMFLLLTTHVLQTRRWR